MPECPASAGPHAAATGHAHPAQQHSKTAKHALGPVKHTCCVLRHHHCPAMPGKAQHGIMHPALHCCRQALVLQPSWQLRHMLPHAHTALGPRLSAEPCRRHTADRSLSPTCVSAVSTVRTKLPKPCAVTAWQPLPDVQLHPYPATSSMTAPPNSPLSAQCPAYAPSPPLLLPGPCAVTSWRPGVCCPGKNLWAPAPMACW